MCLLYENSIKLPLKGDLSLNRLGHSLMLGANHLLYVFGVGVKDGIPEDGDISDK